IHRNRHDELSTFGIGQDLSIKAWQVLGQALLHQDFLIESSDGYGVLSVSDRGIAVLKKELNVEVPLLKSQASEPLASAKVIEQSDLTPFQENLFQHLRQLRKQMADSQSVPPYIIFSDRTLRAMANTQPRSLLEFGELPGVGDKKLKQYGDRFLNAVRAFVSPEEVNAIEPDVPEVADSDSAAESTVEEAIALTHANARPTYSVEKTAEQVEKEAEQVEATPIVSPPKPDPEPTPNLLDRLLGQTYLDTLALHQQGLDVQAIAKKREIQPKTVYTHLVHLLAAGEAVNIDAIVPPERQRQIFRAFYDLHSYASLTPVREYLGESFSYEEIRLVRVAIFGRD
ncbi:MAG: helix-turn-helix domain-containing protein, partial [Cyanobacteria bacterium J06648_11]